MRSAFVAVTTDVAAANGTIWWWNVTPANTAEFGNTNCSDAVPLCANLAITPEPGCTIQPALSGCKTRGILVALGEAAEMGSRNGKSGCLHSFGAHCRRTVMKKNRILRVVFLLLATGVFLEVTLQALAYGAYRLKL